MSLTVIKQRMQVMQISALGPSNPLPFFRTQQPLRGKPVPPHVGLNSQESENPFVFGHDSILPYQVQDNYDRAQKKGEMPVVEISNGRLTCTVAPHLGGRLLSLRDLQRNRDLVFANEAFQPANLGALNAWFSGGIEWNGPIPGHSPFTCSPVFCGIVHTPRGDILRLYEFDRIVEASWQIDLFLPSDDDRLFVHGRLVNPDANDKLAYWWTNIAVQTTPGTRVVSPADYAIEHVLPGNQLERFAFPDPERWDGSYPGNWHDATSVFFRAPDTDRLWIAALDESGTGLAQIASPTMRGRKFFYFGTAPGGGNWMDHLSLPGRGDYIEIQSGIAPTQNQRFALPAQSEIHWTEGLTCLQVNPVDAHSSNYGQAVCATDERISAKFPTQELNEIDTFLREMSRQPMSCRLSTGSAWGVRQERLTGTTIAAGLDFTLPTPNPLFPVSAWDELLDQGFLSAHTLQHTPPDFVVSPRWCDLLRSSVASHGDTWLHALSLGIAALDNEDATAAASHFARSVRLRPNWLAFRQLALVATDLQAREEAYLQAWAQADAPDALAVEIVNFMLEAPHVAAAQKFLEQLPPSAHQLERVTLARARLAAIQQDWDLLESLLDGVFATVREGENLLDTLWNTLQKARWSASALAGASGQSWEQWQRQYPVPKHLDFRMVTPVSSDTTATITVTSTATSATSK